MYGAIYNGWVVCVDGFSEELESLVAIHNSTVNSTLYSTPAWAANVVRKALEHVVAGSVVQTSSTV